VAGDGRERSRCRSIDERADGAGRGQAPSGTSVITGSAASLDRRERLRRARLYLVVEAAALDAARAGLEGGVDMVQLRDKEADDEQILRAGADFRRACDAHGALFWINDRPDLALAAGADGVHLGQGDIPVAEAREQLGPELLIGLSTHTPEQFDAGLASGADELSVGPVLETPTKPGRLAAGLGYVRYAAAHPGAKPWFAIGGIDLDNVREVLAVGAERIVVVRAIRDASDPRAAAAALREALDEAAPSGPEE
jgi:thiamine-phosphate pyrophosphorylase